MAVVLHALPPALFQADSLARIRGLADRIPFHSLAGFECRLAPGASQVDFHVSLPAAALGKLDPPPDWPMPPDLADRFADLYCVLEFDVSLQAPVLPAPGIFLPVNGGAGNAKLPRLRSLFEEELHATPLGPLWPQLERCFSQLPSGAVINCLGLMLSRACPGVKVNVRGLRPEGLAGYLEALRWSGDDVALADIVATLAPWTEELDVALDLSPNGLARHIGLECYLARGPSEEPRWTLLLDHLVGEGLCSPEKAQALLRWPGIDRQATSPVWPSSLEVADRFLGGLVVSYFFRRIHHVKVTFDFGRPREAKAYLIFGHQWLDHRTTPRLSARSDAAGGGSP